MAGHSQALYMHASISQITHLGRVDIVVSAENFFLKVQREERENPDARAETYPTYPVISAAEGKIILSSPCIVVFVSIEVS